MSKKMPSTKSRKIEGGQYKCSWQVLPDGRYAAFIQTNDRIRGLGDTFLDARVNLALEIIREYGDGEAVLEFVKKLPPNPIEAKFGAPGIVRIAGNTKISPPTNAASIFSQKPCSKCGSPQGRRTKEQLTFSSIPNANGVFFEYGRCLFPLFTKKFIQRIQQLNIGEIHFEPVEVIQGKEQLYEVQGSPIARFSRNPIVENSMRGLAHYWGSGCPKCKLECHPYVIRGSEFTQFVRREDLPTPLPDAFILGKGTDIQFCLRLEIWLKLLRKPGSNGLTSSRIGVI